MSLKGNRPNVLAIVVPCYNESEIIETTIAALSEKLNELIAVGLASDSSFICFVDDGSSDETWGLIEKHADSGERVRGVKLAGNVGHQKALLSGLEYSAEKSDLVLTIDADLQDDLNVLEKMLEKYQAGAEIIFGVRNDRSTDSWLKKGTASLYYRLMEFFGVNTLKDHADFRLMAAKAVRALMSFPERNMYIRGVCVSMGFPCSIVYYGRQARIGGETKYTLSKMLSLGWDGITSFSVFPLRLISLLGVLFFLGALMVSLRIVYAHLFLDTTIPGWSSIVLPIFMLGGIQLLSLGVIGEYVAKIYMETKRRPRYLIDKIVGE